MSAVLAGNIYPARIDFARLMRELREHGCTPYRVSQIMCCDPPTAYEWEKGSEPRHSYGAALIALHLQVCGPEYSAKLNKDSVPRT